MEDHLARVRGKMLQEMPLRPRERHVFAAFGDQPALEIDLDVVEGHDAASRSRPRGSTQNRSHARSELSGVERLGDVVVRAEVQAFGLVRDRTLRRQQHDRHGTPLAKLLHDFDAVDIGHDDVEQHDVRPILLSLLQSLFSVAGRDDPEALFLESQRHQFGDSRFIVGDEHQWF